MSPFDFILLQNTVGIETLPFQELRCLILSWFRDCYFDGYVSSNVRYIPCSHRTYCHAESSPGRVQYFKMAKIDPVSPFYPTLWLKKQPMGKRTRSTKNEPLGLKYLLLCVSELEVFTHFTAGLPWKFLNLNDVLQRFPSITQAISQVCFKWMSKCVKIGDYVIEKVVYTRCLGVQIDNTLKWDHRVSELAKPFNTQMLNLLKSLYFLPRQARTDFYFGVILPSVTYCMLVWGSCGQVLFSNLE